MESVAQALPQPFLQPLPADLAAELARRKPAGEDVRIQLAADMSGPRAYGERWLVVTDQRLLLLGRNGAVEAVEVPLSQVKEVTAHNLVGGGLLEIERRDAEPVYLHYSSSLLPRFTEAAGGIRQLSKGEALSLPHQVERVRCERCLRLLPEKDGLCPFCIRRWDTLKRIAAFLQPYWVQATVLMLTAAATAGVELLPPYLIKHILDDALGPVLAEPPTLSVAGGARLLGWFALGLLGVRLASWSLNLVNGLVRADLSSWTGRDVRSRLYGALQFLPLRFHDKRKVGGLVSRFLNDADRLEMLLLFGIPFIVTNALTLVGILALLFYMNWVLTLYVLVPVPFIVVASLRKWDQLRRYWDRWHAKWSRLSTHLNESINGIRVVKAFAQEAREGQRFRTRNDELREASVTAERVWMIFYTVLNFLMTFGVFLVWYIGGRQVVHQELSLGALVAFVSYIWQLYRPLQFFSQLSNFVTRAFAGAERIFEVIDARPEAFRDPGATPLPHLEGRVTFRGVTFGYDPGKPVLKEIELDVAAGEMIGLVGRSGVG
ncbi:MAG: ABC transporter transmembrane domain-containing protein, partial [Candidatus Latescibacterota bacterium]